MAKAEQLKALIVSHLKKDDERFISVALQVAAAEARRGHVAFANQIRELIDKKPKQPLRLISVSPELADLLIEREPATNYASLVVDAEIEKRVARIVAEFHQADKLARHGMHNRRKILLTGPPGTGKTMTASILARQTRIPFFVVQIDRLFTRYLGETNAKLRQVFAVIRERPGVYLFDEFDALASSRGSDNDVGEMRRVLNALLQFIEEDDSQSLIVAATNSIESIDSALFRRFDDIIHYQLPGPKEIEGVIRNRLATFYAGFGFDPVVSAARGLSHAEIVEACNDTIKDAILGDQSKITQKALVEMLRERKAAYHTAK